MDTNIKDKITHAKLEIERLNRQRSHRFRDSRAYNNLTNKIHSKEKKLSYSCKCIKRTEEQEKRARIARLVNPTA